MNNPEAQFSSGSAAPTSVLKSYVKHHHQTRLLSLALSSLVVPPAHPLQYHDQSLQGPGTHREWIPPSRRSRRRRRRAPGCLCRPRPFPAARRPHWSCHPSIHELVQRGVVAHDADIEGLLLDGAHASFPERARHVDRVANELERLFDQRQLLELRLLRGLALRRRSRAAI